ncbi:excinuclease ABC subunit C [Enterococcus sp. DIV0188]|uniref:excinuclease ABC subunit C n=1 Tax=Enterococcus sp. DIV0188 TaxID=2774858 RepID=UPI003F683C97
MLSLTTITVMEIFMKTYDYQGKLIKEDTTTTSIAYVQCSCGCLASRVSSDLDKYKCSLCKRIYTIKKNSIMGSRALSGNLYR